MARDGARYTSPRGRGRATSSICCSRVARTRKRPGPASCAPRLRSRRGCAPPRRWRRRADWRGVGACNHLPPPPTLSPPCRSMGRRRPTLAHALAHALAPQAPTAPADSSPQADPGAGGRRRRRAVPDTDKFGVADSAYAEEAPRYDLVLVYPRRTEKRKAAEAKAQLQPHPPPKPQALPRGALVQRLRSAGLAAKKSYASEENGDEKLLLVVGATRKRLLLAAEATGMRIRLCAEFGGDFAKFSRAPSYSTARTARRYPRRCGASSSTRPSARACWTRCWRRTRASSWASATRTPTSSASSCCTTRPSAWSLKRSWVRDRWSGPTLCRCGTSKPTSGPNTRSTLPSCSASRARSGCPPRWEWYSSPSSRTLAAQARTQTG
mmetsp:Transcript_32218/g.80211  ORF Transcript_32218/g.80211 Transcript_32218/m.80211 type:complete len:381 (+) Transcript_32218:451-1593(+)